MENSPYEDAREKKGGGLGNEPGEVHDGTQHVQGEENDAPEDKRTGEAEGLSNWLVAMLRATDLVEMGSLG